MCSCQGQLSLICRRVKASQRRVQHVVSTECEELCACNKGICPLPMLKFSFMDSPSFKYQCVTALKVVKELFFNFTTTGCHSFQQTSANLCTNCLGVIGCRGNKPGCVGELNEWSGKQITASVFLVSSPGKYFLYFNIFV